MHSAKTTVRVLTAKSQLRSQANEWHLQVKVKQMARKRLITPKNRLKQQQAQRRRHHHKKTRVLTDEEVSPSPKIKINPKKLQTLTLKHVIDLRQNVRLQQLSLQVPLQDLQGQEGTGPRQPTQPKQ